MTSSALIAAIVTQSIDTYLLEEHSYQISSPSDLKRRSLRLFKEEKKKNNNNNNNKMSSDMTAVPDLKRHV